MAAVLLAILQESVILLFSKIMKKHSPPKALSRIIQFLAVCLIIASIFLLWDRIIALFPENIIDRFLKMNMSERSVYIRTEFFQDAFKLISKNWLFGVGGGGWEVLHYGVQESYYISRAVHNHYLEVFVGSGILGSWPLPPPLFCHFSIFSVEFLEMIIHRKELFLPDFYQVLLPLLFILSSILTYPLYQWLFCFGL